MTPPLALVGMACRYPDARSPAELWENALARRRAFRRIPKERLRLEDYLPGAPGAAEDPDTTYATRAALLEGYDFDRVRFRVGTAAFRSADLSHWLALDVAADALGDAGFPDGRGLPRESTGALVGNSLTGEFSRADALRLRFPYVRRVVEAGLDEAGLVEGDRGAFMERLEARYKAPFAPPNEETLAGGLSNTIAGRICNHFDLQGGGYTVDGACASSLLAVTTACSALTAGDLDVALAGGVDLSLDPFELVGFSRAGALAKESMRVYDARSTGFLPGEGAGFVVLMRLDDALSLGKRIYATIRGWGVSSDGSGGLTRPEVKGQILALRRAYARAGFGVDTVGYFEGHGTGTAVGDTTELATLSLGRREANPGALPAAIGSIKANIGHTKAAAGVAGLIKATMAVHTQILPPTTGCELPHPELGGPRPALRVLAESEAWPADRLLRAGVSAMGFGGINAHLVLEGSAETRRGGLTPRERSQSATQDAELFLLGAASASELGALVDRCASLAPRLSLAELGDLAASLGRGLARPAVRAAVVASDPDELAARLATLSSWLRSGRSEGLDPASGIFLGHGHGEPRIGFLFPGQGAPVYSNAGALGRRFEIAGRTYRDHPLPAMVDAPSTATAQPSIVLASLAALRVLAHLGISASVAAGHSLGEIVALHWAGAFTDDALARIAERRGRAFAELGLAGGAMAAIEAGASETAAMLQGSSAVIAGLNAPGQTVISGERAAVEAVMSTARAKGLSAVELRVSHAFHSPGMAPAAPVLADHLKSERFARLDRAVISTVTGARLDPDRDLRDLLVQQVTLPVRFAEAFAELEAQVDLLIEVGPGRALGALAAAQGKAPVISLDAGGASLRGLLSAVGAAFALGAGVDTGALFSGRFVRPFDLDRPLRFLANPCESAPIAEVSARSARLPDAAELLLPPAEPTAQSPLDLVFQLVMERTELPRSALSTESRLLGDLHLSSITVGQLVIEAARRLGLLATGAPVDYANATLGEMAQALEERARGGGAKAAPLPPLGVEAWVRAFEVAWVERPRRPAPAGKQPRLRVLAPVEHPLRAALVEALSGPGEVEGVLICLPRELDRAALSLLLEGAAAGRSIAGASRFVLVHQGAGAAFARTLHLERPGAKTAVIEVPIDHPSSAAWVLGEIASAPNFVEARYDATGARFQPLLRFLPDRAEQGELPMGRDDVLLVTGGGKGIAAECALSLAKKSGARLALLGRSRPESDRELAANLERIAAAGVTMCYVVADVTDAGAVQAAVREIHRSLGPVTGLLHGAGINTPTALAALSVSAFSQTLAVKVQGLRNVVSAIAPERLRVLAGFSSIIGRAGMPGEADYAVANEELSRLIERFAAEHPRCLCRSIEWSVWSGVGMGEKLGRMEALRQQGITPIPPDQGTAALERLLRDRNAPVVTVVTGRFGDIETLEVERPELPLLRFLEHPLVYLPGVELIAESELSSGTDPYLDDHVVSGEPLFPAVMSLEAMAQVASTLHGGDGIPIFEEVLFQRPVTVPRGGRLRIRVSALAQRPGLLDVVLRCESTGFQVDHARARCRFAPSPMEPGEGHREIEVTELPRVALDPEAEMYGTVLFHQGRFRRLGGYRRLSSTGCIAELTGTTGAGWFGAFFPPTLLLGDPARRDATMHAIQACVPHATLLPVALGRLVTCRQAARGSAAIVEATERSHEGDTFVYDVSVKNTMGSIVERWEGLTLKVVRGGEALGPLPEALLGPYLERKVRELAPGVAVTAAFHHAAETPRRARSDQAMQQALGSSATIRRRGDGRPEVLGAPHLAISAAHSEDSTLAVAGAAPLGCDLELIVARPTSVWRELLGPDRFRLAELCASECGEELGSSATRIWTAGEALRKAGAVSEAPILLVSVAEQGWVTLRSGGMIVLSGVLRARRRERRLAVAVLVGDAHARL